ncbi:MAG: hypothetical protein HZB51_22020 [Chloroflexi bacterium]|nr:hypothetical protein [Chloroflexota bacterium]
MKIRKIAGLSIMGLLLLGLFTWQIDPAQSDVATLHAPIVGSPVTPKLSQPVRTLPAVTPVTEDCTRTRVMPFEPVAPVPHRPSAATLRLSEPAPGLSPGLILSRDGISFTNSACIWPPDTTGDVGLTHYVQAVNGTFKIFDKQLNALTGAIVLNALWQGSGGQCEQLEMTDPIIGYDPQANRWIVMHIAFDFSKDTQRTPLCIAVSTSPDPTERFHLYEFFITLTNIPDYPKLGMWRDGYYVGYNEVGGDKISAVVFDRQRMIDGQAASYIKFTNVAERFVMPSDLDGWNPAPPGTPNYFYTFVSNSGATSTFDGIQLYAFHADFDNPTASTFSLDHTLALGAFELMSSRITQPTTPDYPSGLLDALGDYPMQRLVYRNLGTHASLAGNFTIDVGNATAGIRWFELRQTPGATWDLYQEGAQSPDYNHRWLGSLALDRQGNLALGYSVSGSSLNPSIRYAARSVSDPLGLLRSEAKLITGRGVAQQISPLAPESRWGDYSTMVIDPADDCTFWYTNEYFPVNAKYAWFTHIGTFRMPTCVSPTYFPIIFK